MRNKDEIVRDVCEKLSAQTGAPFEYDHFTEGEAINPPFVLYRRVAAPNFSADGVVYAKGGGVDLELYAATPEKMAELMEIAEQLLDEEEIFYNKTADTVYITSEDFYETLYEI